MLFDGQVKMLYTSATPLTSSITKVGVYPMVYCISTDSRTMDVHYIDQFLLRF